MIHIILSLIVVICAIYAIRKVLSSDSKRLEFPFPQSLENGVIIIKLADLSSLWVDLTTESSVEQNIEDQEETLQVIEDEKPQVIGKEWFQQKEFLTYLINCIDKNMNIVSNNRYDSFSFGEIVYLSSGALWSYINGYGLSHSIKEAHNKAKREPIMLAVITELTNLGVANVIGSKFSVEYLITFKDGAILKKHFIPLNVEYFTIERKKEGILNEIIKINMKENEK
jgi:hypothetical protein